MLISSHHPLVDKLTARTCLLLLDTSVWLQSDWLINQFDRFVKSRSISLFRKRTPGVDLQ